MLKIALELTNRCNLKCIHCFRDRHGRLEDFPLDLLDKLVEESRVFGGLGLHFTGGEPTMHYDFEKIILSLIQYTYKGDLKYCTFVTNGYDFKQAFPLFLCLKKTVPFFITFSLDGAKREIHDKIRGKGSYDRVMEAVYLCNKEGINYGVQLILNKINESDLEKMSSLALAMKAASLKIVLPIPTPSLIENNYMFSFKEAQILQEKIKNQIIIFSQWNVYRRKRINYLTHLIFQNLSMLPTFPCFFCSDCLNINYRGNLTFCCNLSNYIGSDNNDKDIVGSLYKENLMMLYKKYLSMFAKFHNDRFNYIANKDLDLVKSSIFLTGLCAYCLRYFGKHKKSKIFEDFGIFI